MQNIETKFTKVKPNCRHKFIAHSKKLTSEEDKCAYCQDPDNEISFACALWKGYIVIYIRPTSVH